MGLMPSDEEIRIAITALTNAQAATKDIKALEKSIKDSTVASERMRRATAGMISPNASKEADKLDKSLDKVNKTGEKTNKTFSSMINVIKGALTAMLTLAALRAITTFFSNALKSAEEFRGKMAELNFAEAILSKKGMEITKKELDTFIADIESKFKYLSTLKVTGIVSTVAQMGAEFKLTKENIVGLSEAIAFLQLKEQAYGMQVSESGSIINAALDGRSNYFNALGINITKTAIKEKAYAMGLAEHGQAITKEMSNQAAIALLIEQTSGKYDELIASIEKVNPALANQLVITKKMEDSQVAVGNAVLVVKDAWNSFLRTLISGGEFDDLKDSLVNIITTFADFINLLSDAYATYKDIKEAQREVTGGLNGWGEQLQKWIGPLQTFITLLELLFLGFTTIVGAIVTAGGAMADFMSYFSGKISYEELGQNLGKRFSDGLLAGIAVGLKPLVSGKDDIVSNRLRDVMKLFGKDISTPATPDTPTMANGIDDESENVQEAVEKMHEDVLKEYKDMQQDIEDATIDFNRKMDDISSEYQFKRLDAERDHQNKIEDINRDSNARIVSLNTKQREEAAKARQASLDREKEYQNKLLEMREDFLMDLDDALHARDARQILKLIKQYNLEKTQAQRQHDLENQKEAASAKLRQQSFENERRDIEADRKRKLEDEAIAHQRKLQQLAEEEARERLQAQVALQRKLADIQLNQQRRLQAIGAGLVAELNLTAQGLAAVVALYTQTYGPGGAIDQIYQGMLQRLAEQKQSTVPGLSPGANPNDPQSQPGGYGNNKGKQGYNFAFAEGGSLLVNKPTSVLMGEGGVPEVGTFMPVGKRGDDINKIFTNLSRAGGSAMGGKIELGLTLSPDLEARIISNTLNKTANVILKVNRSK